VFDSPLAAFIHRCASCVEAEMIYCRVIAEASLPKSLTSSPNPCALRGTYAAEGSGPGRSAPASDLHDDHGPLVEHHQIELKPTEAQVARQEDIASGNEEGRDSLFCRGP
jgi:hypothetical protein